MKNIFKLMIAFFTITGLLTTSCVKDDFDQPEVPDPCDIRSGLTPTKGLTVDSLKSIYSTFEVVDASGEIRKFPEDSNYVYEGTVISSTEQGNIYKEIYIQDATGGLKISTDADNTFADYKIGQLVHIKLSGLTCHYETGAYKTSMIEIGFGKYTDNNGRVKLGYVTSDILKDYVRNNSCPQDINLRVITLDALSDDYIGRLVKIEDVEIVDSELGETYASFQQTKDRHIRDCANNTILLRNSGYSSFYSDTMPSGKGRLQAIYTKYGSTYQLVISDTTDLSFIKERCQ